MNGGLDIAARLRTAVRGVDAPPFLDARIRHQIRVEKLPRHWFPRSVPITASATVFVVSLIAYQLGHLRLTVRSQEAYIASVSTHVATLMRVGLGDHLHCSVFRSYPKSPPAPGEFIETMTPRYAGLIPIIRSQVPEGSRMMLAHQCRYHGRTFVHLSLTDDSNILSLVLTRKAEGESFGTEDMLPALVQLGIPMYQAGVQRFQLTAFETRDYLVYFISDLDRQQNTSLMLAMAPRVKDFLAKLEL